MAGLRLPDSGAFNLNNLLVSFLIGLLVLSASARAAEVDQFTVLPDEPAALPDSVDLLDLEVNRLIQQALDRANSRVMEFNPKKATRWQQPGCDATRLYEKLILEFGESIEGRLEAYAEESNLLSRRKVALQESIYRGFSWQSSPTLVLSERMASVITLAGVEIGTDKLGHFFSEGYSYFLVTDQLRKSLESGLLFGEWSESVYFGAQTTGVYSFADLTANFQGLRFWNRVLALQKDPLERKKPDAYVQCIDDQWQQVATFHWNDYVDAAWNESINCPLLRSEELLRNMQQQGLHCRFDRLPISKYGIWHSRLLNQDGLGVLPDHLQAEVIMRQRVDQHDLEMSPETLEYIGEVRLRLELWRQKSIQKARAHEARAHEQ